VDVSIVAWVAGSTLSTWRIHQGSTWRIHQGFLCSQQAPLCSTLFRQPCHVQPELGSRDPFGQYLEMGPRGCEYCSLGSRFNTPPGGSIKAPPGGSIKDFCVVQAGGQATSTTSELSFSNPGTHSDNTWRWIDVDVSRHTHPIQSHISTFYFRMRPYHWEYTETHPNFEVKPN
jgi:hypothetical protein